MENSIFLQLLPHIILGTAIVLAVVIEISTEKSKQILPWLAVLVFFANAIIALYRIPESVTVYGMLSVGGKAAIFDFIFNFGALIGILSSVNYIKKYGAYFGEFYIIVLTSVLGMMLLAGSLDLFTVFLGLELMSISFYILAGINRKKLSSNEASLKYFLLGAFATGFVVYGIALIYGSMGNTNLKFMFNHFPNLISHPLFVIGMGLFLIGFSFKIAAFPFHMWVPDVYQGSATTVTGIMSTIGKAAAFSVLIITLTAVTTGSAPHTFEDYFIAISLLSMLYGSIVAIAQKNLKRMLAYSSIVHAGYMSIGLAAGNAASIGGIIFYLAAYTFMNLGAFGVISIIEGENDDRVNLDSYAGLNKKSPVLAGFMALFMFALAGIPPLAGFFGKYYVFVGAIEQNLVWLAIIGITASVISVYFYLRVVVYMYFKDELEDFTIEKNIPGLTAVAISALAVLIFGIVPDLLMNVIISALK